MAAMDEVTTTRFTRGEAAAASSIERVPRTAGSTRSRCGSLTVSWNGLAMWMT